MYLLGRLMFLVQNGRFFSVTEKQFAAWLLERAAGKDETLEKYGAVLWGACGGDVSNLSPASAAILKRAYQAAAEAVANGYEPSRDATSLELSAHRIAEIYAEEGFALDSPANDEKAA